MFPEIDLLTNLIVQLKWLRSALEALRAGNPLPPIQDIPEGPIGELIQALQQVERKFQDQLALFQQTSQSLQAREEELQGLKVRLEALGEELRSSRETNDRQEAAKSELEARVQGLEDRLSRLHREKTELGKYLEQVETRAAAMINAVSQEAQAFSAFTAEMKAALHPGNPA